MSLNPLAREANYKDSIKKYFVDNIYRTENIPVTFDKMINFPEVFQESFKVFDDRVDRWISIISGGIVENSPLITAYPAIYVCTRRDIEGYKLAQLKDTVRSLLDETMAIPFYRSYPAPIEWQLLTYMQVFHAGESEQLTTKDETKFKRISLSLKWTATI
jgi:hypothetical protein